MSDLELIAEVRKHAGELDDAVGCEGHAARLLRRLADRLEGRLGPERMLKSGQVCDWMNFSRRTLFRLVALGKFPEPVRWNRKVVRWRESDLRAWLEAQR